MPIKKIQLRWIKDEETFQVIEQISISHSHTLIPNHQHLSLITTSISSLTHTHSSVSMVSYRQSITCAMPISSDTYHRSQVLVSPLLMCSVCYSSKTLQLLVKDPKIYSVFHSLYQHIVVFSPVFSCVLLINTCHWVLTPSLCLSFLYNIIFRVYYCILSIYWERVG